jgi:hypothetical protein
MVMALALSNVAFAEPVDANQGAKQEMVQKAPAKPAVHKVVQHKKAVKKVKHAVVKHKHHHHKHHVHHHHKHHVHHAQMVKKSAPAKK